MKRWQILASSLSRVGSRGVKEGAAGAVHRAHGVGGQPNGVRCGAVRIIRVGVDECRPTPPQPENFVSGCDGDETTDLMHEFNPGTSPPPVNIPIRMGLILRSRLYGDECPDPGRLGDAHGSFDAEHASPQCSRGRGWGPGDGAEGPHAREEGGVGAPPGSGRHERPGVGQGPMPGGGRGQGPARVWANGNPA